MSIFTRKQADPVGSRGEKLAAKHLKNKGYKILSLNYRSPRGYMVGEIDIVAQFGQQIVFVEVKTRIVKSLENSDVKPEEAIDQQKLRKLERICQQYLYYNHQRQVSYRLDAVSVLLEKGTGMSRVWHMEHIYL